MEREPVEWVLFMEGAETRLHSQMGIVVGSNEGLPISMRNLQYNKPSKATRTSRSKRGKQQAMIQRYYVKLPPLTSSYSSSILPSTISSHSPSAFPPAPRDREQPGAPAQPTHAPSC